MAIAAEHARRGVRLQVAVPRRARRVRRGHRAGDPARASPSPRAPRSPSATRSPRSAWRLWTRAAASAAARLGVARAVPRPRGPRRADPAHRGRAPAELDVGRAAPPASCSSRCSPHRSCGRGCARRWSCPPCWSTSSPRLATADPNDEPWPSLLLRTLVMAGVGRRCVALSWIQRSRVRDDRPAGAGPHRAARRADRAGGTRAADALRAAARRRAAVRARRPLRPRRRPRHRRRPSLRPAGAGTRWSRRGCCARRSPSCTRRCWSAPGCPPRCATSSRRPRPVAGSPPSSTWTDGPPTTARRSTGCSTGRPASC